MEKHGTVHSSVVELCEEKRERVFESLPLEEVTEERSARVASLESTAERISVIVVDVPTKRFDNFC